MGKAYLRCLEEHSIVMFMPSGKSWSEKLREDKGFPKVEKITERMSKKRGTGTVVIPAPIEVDEIMRKVPRGKVVTINEIRASLARKHKATVGCPMTTGIFAWIAANAAVEEEKAGRKDITPYWRTLKTGGVINEKYPGGWEAQKRLLEEEGHTVVAKGKRRLVTDYQQTLAMV